MPNPTRQEIIDAHNALDELTKWANGYHAYYGDGSHLPRIESILAALPPKPQPANPKHPQSSQAT